MNHSSNYSPATLPYESSRSFQQLKGIKEKIQQNLTTSQYMRIYDDYLTKAAAPIIQSSNVFDVFLGRVVSWQAKSSRRKVSFQDQEDLPRLAANFFLQSDSEEKLKAYADLQLDRGIRISFLNDFHESMIPYRKACDEELEPSNSKTTRIAHCLKIRYVIESSIEFSRPLIGVIRESEFWMAKAMEFKQSILEKYIRLALNAAQKDYVEFFRHSESLDDILQTYIMYASRAIDRCDYKKGPLTSHIQTHFLAARNSLVKKRDRTSSQFYFENQLTQGEDDVSSELRSPSFNHELNSSNSQSEVELSALAKLVDPIGATRSYLKIREHLSEKDRMLLNLISIR